MGAFDGSGNFVRSYSWANDKANGINITASRVDTEDTGFATGLSLCVTRDGQGKMAANSLPSADNSYSLGSTSFRWSNINGLISFPQIGGARTVSIGSAAYTPSVAVTFNATTMTLNCTLANVFTATFTANVTSAPTLSNPGDGQTINWFITQDATGSRTMTWPTSFKWPGGVAATLSTAANAVDLLTATYRSSTGFWYATLAKAFG